MLDNQFLFCSPVVDVIPLGPYTLIAQMIRTSVATLTSPRAPVVCYHHGVSAVAGITDHFLKHGLPVVLTRQLGHMVTLEELATNLGDANVLVQRFAPARAPDILHGSILQTARLWQVCEYAGGKPPPLNALSATNAVPWRAFGWRPWDALNETDVSTALRALLSWPVDIREALPDVGDVGERAVMFDIEPPTAVTRLHRTPDSAHTLIAVVTGEKEILLYHPDHGARLRPGFGTCDADQCGCDPLGLDGRMVPDVRPISAILVTGDVLLVPGNWWWWARTRHPTLTLRRSFCERTNAAQTLSQTTARRRDTELALRPESTTFGQVEAWLGADGVAVLREGKGLRVHPHHFVALHFVVYDTHGQPVETSHLLPHCIVTSPDVKSRDLVSKPFALKEISLRRVLHSPGARSGAKLGFIADHPSNGRVSIVVEVAEILERETSTGHYILLKPVQTKRRSSSFAAGPLTCRSHGHFVGRPLVALRFCKWGMWSGSTARAKLLRDRQR